MALCTKCEEPMVSEEAVKCRECIIKDNEKLIQDMVSSFENKKLRQLMIAHSEARNRIIKDRKENEE